MIALAIAIAIAFVWIWTDARGPFLFFLNRINLRSELGVFIVSTAVSFAHAIVDRWLMFNVMTDTDGVMYWFVCFCTKHKIKWLWLLFFVVTLRRKVRVNNEMGYHPSVRNTYTPFTWREGKHACHQLFQFEIGLLPIPHSRPKFMWCFLPPPFCEVCN